MKPHNLLILVLLAITACKVTKPYNRAQNIAGNGLYRDTAITDTSTIANIPWRQFFADTVLQHLIQEGIDHNLDLGIAIARIHEAEANFRQSKEAFYPSLLANASGALQKAPGTPSSGLALLI